MSETNTKLKKRDDSVFIRWQNYLKKRGVSDMKYAQWEHLKDFLVKQEGYSQKDVVVAARNYDIKKGQAVGLKKGRGVISDITGQDLEMDRRHILGYMDKIVNDFGLSGNGLIQLANSAIENGSIGKLTALEKLGLSVLAAKGRIKVK